VPAVPDYVDGSFRSAGDEAAAPAVAEVRRLLARVAGFKSVEIVNRDANLGLAGNITGGVCEYTTPRVRHRAQREPQQQNRHL